MESAEIYKKLTSVFQDVLEDESLAVEASTTADDVDGWDSLNHIRLMMSVQKMFGVKFTAFEIGKLKNVGDLANLVQTKVA